MREKISWVTTERNEIQVQFDGRGLDIEKVKGNIVKYIMSQAWPECIAPYENHVLYCGTATD